MPFAPRMIPRESSTTPNQPLTPQQQATVQAIIQTPEGYRLQSVQQDYTQTPAQVGRETSGTPVYVATYTPIPQPQSIGEQIASVNPARVGAEWGAIVRERLTGEKPSEAKIANVSNFVTNLMGSGIPGVKGTGTQVLGGIVSSFEAPVYAVAGLAGVQGLPRARTLTGGLVGSGIASVIAWKPTATEELEYMKDRPAFAAGTVFGDVLIGYAVGYATSKVVHKFITPRVQARVDTSYAKALEAGTPYKPSLAERLFMKATGARPQGLSPEIVTAKGTIAGNQPLSFSDLRAGEMESYFWGEKPMPKTTEMWVAKTPSVASKVEDWMASNVFKGKGSWSNLPMGASGGLPQKAPLELLEEPWVGPYNPQLGAPYIPSALFITGARSVLPLGVGVAGVIGVAGAKLLPAAQAKPQLQTRLSPDVKPLQRQPTRQELMIESEQAATLAQDQFVSQEQEQKLVPVQTLKTQQVQIQRQIQQQTERLLIAPGWTPPLMIGQSFGFKFEGGGGPSMFFYPKPSRLGKRIRYYPIVPPEEVFGSMVGAKIRKHKKIKVPKL